MGNLRNEPDHIPDRLLEANTSGGIFFGYSELKTEGSIELDN
jgi:hypothetical protein